MFSESEAENEWEIIDDSDTTTTTTQKSQASQEAVCFIQNIEDILKEPSNTNDLHFNETLILFLKFNNINNLFLPKNKLNMYNRPFFSTYLKHYNITLNIIKSNFEEAITNSANKHPVLVIGNKEVSSHPNITISSAPSCVHFPKDAQRLSLPEFIENVKNINPINVDEIQAARLTNAVMNLNLPQLLTLRSEIGHLKLKPNFVSLTNAEQKAFAKSHCLTLLDILNPKFNLIANKKDIEVVKGIIKELLYWGIIPSSKKTGRFFKEDNPLDFAKDLIKQHKEIKGIIEQALKQEPTDEYELIIALMKAYYTPKPEEKRKHSQDKLAKEIEKIAQAELPKDPPARIDIFARIGTIHAHSPLDKYGAFKGLLECILDKDKFNPLLDTYIGKFTKEDELIPIENKGSATPLLTNPWDRDEEMKEELKPGFSSGL